MNAYERLCAARKSGRPTARKYIEALCDRFFELHGDRRFADDPAILGGIAELDGTPVTVGFYATVEAAGETAFGSCMDDYVLPYEA